ncbi:MAG: glucose 1-dehydrogenase [Gammaproteobacteria bacterium]|nr:glucose 1-dehydrogenase [Gammaproteobacteria bacterium]MBK9428853.1 glucose 1-dehydrogenase [Gammaproteobacteria bacterium]
MSNLNGKVALITGAARGQGAAEARLFAQRGAKVVLCDILDSEGQAVAAEIGANATYVRLDVTSEASWQAAVKAAVGKFGKLNVLVNNAGIVKVTNLADCPLDEYMQVIQVNQVGVFLGMKTVVPAMKQAGGGSIVNISSIDGLIGMTGGAAYCASKFAVRGMTKVAALELGKDGIRVNSIHPGGILTPMITGAGLDAQTAGEIFGRVPLQRIGQPEEIATLAAYLASDDASYSTGSEFIADGGLTAGFALEA